MVYFCRREMLASPLKVCMPPAAGGVPGGAGGELTLLDEQHVAPADLRQVVEDARADHAAADDHGSRGSLHGSMISLQLRHSNTGGALQAEGRTACQEPLAQV